VNGAAAERLHRLHIVADEEHRPPFLRSDIAHLAEAAFLKLRIADGEHLIHMRICGSRCAATAKASRTDMPLE
jgi:hypothetical protein